MKKKNNDADLLKRQHFLETYNEFTRWIYSLGFRSGNYKESTRPLDYNYSYYKDYVQGMHGIELYVHDVLKISIRFLRDQNEHKLLFVAEDLEDVVTLEAAKSFILDKVKTLKGEQINALISIPV